MTRIPVKERPAGLRMIPALTRAQAARGAMRAYALAFRQDIARDDLTALVSLSNAIAWRCISQGKPAGLALVQAAFNTIKVLSRFPLIPSL